MIVSTTLLAPFCSLKQQKNIKMLKIQHFRPYSPLKLQKKKEGIRIYSLILYLYYINNQKLLWVLKSSFSLIWNRFYNHWTTTHVNARDLLIKIILLPTTSHIKNSIFRIYSPSAFPLPCWFNNICLERAWIGPFGFGVF